MQSVAETTKLIEQHGIGNVATAIIFAIFVVGFIYMFRAWNASNKENGVKQVEALQKVAESNNNVASALDIIKDTFVSRMSDIEHKLDVCAAQQTTHHNDVQRIETKFDRSHDILLQVSERTKKCLHS